MIYLIIKISLNNLTKITNLLKINKDIFFKFFLYFMIFTRKETFLYLLLLLYFKFFIFDFLHGTNFFLDF